MSFLRIKEEHHADELEIDEDGEDQLSDDFQDNLVAFDAIDPEAELPTVVDHEVGEDSQSPPAESVDLDLLPRPVSELNCKQARSYLVKLLRAANNGNNPSYGMPNKCPPFWPNYYWPWERLTDVHTKPSGMVEPLQYSEMMKLAIRKGYQYYGYDPDTYFDVEVEEREKERETFMPGAVRAPSIQWQMSTESDEPPRLPRPASKLNCIQSRTVLSKLLRYQLGGNNPNYGSPSTEPPWWPNELIRWVDMVDLRGKPPYLPDNSTYTDVLKLAIKRCLEYYGFDPENHLSREVIAPATSTPGTSSKSMSEDTENRSKKSNVSLEARQQSSSSESSGPPKLAMPISKMNCGDIRVALSRLLWYHNNSTPPSYGNIASMPQWWPNTLMDWTKLKNLRHGYGGPLGNSYTNCLRIATSRGYSFYGLDADKHVIENGEAKAEDNGTSIDAPISMTPVILSPKEVMTETPAFTITPLSTQLKKPMPSLVPISSLKNAKLNPHAPNGLSPSLRTNGTPPKRGSMKLVTPQKESIVKSQLYPQALLNNPSWFPPKMSTSAGIVTTDKVLESLKSCGVLLERRFGGVKTRQTKTPKSLTRPTVRKPLTKVFQDDLKRMNHTDLTIVGRGGHSVMIHKSVLAAQSPILCQVIKELIPYEKDISISFPDFSKEMLTLFVEALYHGKVMMDSQQKLEFDKFRPMFHCYGLFQSMKEDKEAALELRRPISKITKKTRKRKTSSLSDLSLMEPIVQINEEPLVNPKKPRKKTPSAPLSKHITWNDLEREVAYGRDSFIRFLVREKLLQGHLICGSNFCNGDVELVEDNRYFDGHVWTCKHATSTNSSGHTLKVPVRTGSILPDLPQTLEDITKGIFCWQHALPLDQAHTKSKITMENLKIIYEMCNEHFNAE